MFTLASDKLLRTHIVLTFFFPFQGDIDNAANEHLLAADSPPPILLVGFDVVSS